MRGLRFALRTPVKHLSRLPTPDEAWAGVSDSRARLQRGVADRPDLGREDVPRGVEFRWRPGVTVRWW